MGKTREELLKEAMEEANKAGMVLPTEDANSNLQRAINAACFMAVEDNGLSPLLDVVMYAKDGSTKHVGAMFPDVDFSDSLEKMKAITQAGLKMGRDLSEKMVPMQVTMCSEALMRNMKDDTVERQEVIVAATRTWDGREGVIARRTVRDLKDRIEGTAPAREELVTDDNEKETPLLSAFFLGFGVGAAEGKEISPEVKQQAAEVRERLSLLFD